MKVLVDECVPLELVRLFTGRESRMALVQSALAKVRPGEFVRVEIPRA